MRDRPDRHATRRPHAQPVQRAFNSSPCMWIRFVAPARSCRSSMFCVTICTGPGHRRSELGERAMRRIRRHLAVPGAAGVAGRRSAAPASGWRANASAVATSSNRLPVHRPSVPRNVGSPNSAEIPAPVRTTMAASGFMACLTTPLPFRVFVKDNAISPQVDRAFRLGSTRLRSTRLINSPRAFHCAAPL